MCNKDTSKGLHFTSTKNSNFSAYWNSIQWYFAFWVLEKREHALSNNVPISGVNLKSPFSSNSNQIVRARPYISPSDRGISFII
jgi:hypothetical protein